MEDRITSVTYEQTSKLVNALNHVNIWIVQVPNCISWYRSVFQGIETLPGTVY